MQHSTSIQAVESRAIRWLFNDTRLAFVWLIIRLYVGWEWLIAGWGKITNPDGVWVGTKAGLAVQGFLTGALQKTGGIHPDVTNWYAWFIKNVALQHTVAFSYMVTYGELFIGIALIIGLFVGIASFFGAFMNLNFLLAGTVSSNPVLLVLALGLLKASRIAGYYGLDSYVRRGGSWLFSRKR